MTNTMDLWLALTRGWIAAANSVAEAQRALLHELAPPRKRQFDAATQAMRQPTPENRRGPGRGRPSGAPVAQVAAEELGAAAGYKPSRRRRGRPRKRSA